MAIDEKVRLLALNLHDAYINANLVRTLMMETPPVGAGGKDPAVWTVGDRARLERMWWAMTYVLIEAWRARASNIESLLKSCRSAPKLEDVEPPAWK